MLTPTQLREAHQLLMDGAKSIIDNHDSISARNFARGAIAVTSYQQERIAELESNAEAHALAMKAGKAMLAAETARADAAEQKLSESLTREREIIDLMATYFNYSPEDVRREFHRHNADRAHRIGDVFTDHGYSFVFGRFYKQRPSIYPE